MSDYHIGRLIRGFRESKNISQKKLYYGIRRENQVYKIEGGEQEVPKLLVDILLERMGLSTDIYGYEFSIKEYELFQCRADLLGFLEKGEYEEAEKLCTEYEEKASKRDRLQQQFIRMIKLIIAMEKGASPEHLYQEAEQILFLTVPRFKAREIREYLLSGIERTLVAVQAEALCRMEGKEDEGMQMYYNLLFYMEETCTDLWEQERQIPALVLLMVRWLWKWERYSEIWICEKGIKILRKSMKLTLLEPLMEYEMKGWETGYVTIPDGESAKEWRAGLDALQAVREEYQVERKYKEEHQTGTLFSLMLRQSSRGQILGETLRRIRKEKGISVDELAEGICEPETLRRIEGGAIRPRQKTYGKLMKKLGQREYAYHPLICSDDYRMYECYQKILWHMNRFEYEKAEYELKKLENGLDQKEKINYQILLKLSAILKEQLKQISQEEKLKCLYNALGVTIPKEVGPEKWPLSREEEVIWNNIAITLEKLEKREEAIEVLMMERKHYTNIVGKILNNKKGYMLLLHNLCIFLSREKQYFKVIEHIILGVKSGLEWEFGNYVVEYLYIFTWNLEKLMEESEENIDGIKEKCLLNLKNDFAIAGIMQYTSYKHLLKKHCREYYGVSIEDL